MEWRFCLTSEMGFEILLFLHKSILWASPWRLNLLLLESVIGAHPLLDVLNILLNEVYFYLVISDFVIIFYRRDSTNLERLQIFHKAQLLVGCRASHGLSLSLISHLSFRKKSVLSLGCHSLYGTVYNHIGWLYHIFTEGILRLLSIQSSLSCVEYLYIWKILRLIILVLRQPWSNDVYGNLVFSDLTTFRCSWPSNKILSCTFEVFEICLVLIIHRCLDHTTDLFLGWFGSRHSKLLRRLSLGVSSCFCLRLNFLLGIFI